MKGYMEFKIKSNGDILSDIHLTAIDTDPEKTLIPAFIGFNQQVYADMQTLLRGPPLGDLQEIISFTSEIYAEKDDVEVFRNEVEIVAKRYLVIEGLKGMSGPLNDVIVKFITNEFFI